MAEENYNFEHFFDKSNPVDTADQDSEWGEYFEHSFKLLSFVVVYQVAGLKRAG